MKLYKKTISPNREIYILKKSCCHIHQTEQITAKLAKRRNKMKDEKSSIFIRLNFFLNKSKMILIIDMS